MMRRSNVHGFSLVELLVSMACGSILLAAAVSYTAQHTMLLGRTTDRTDRSQAARLTIDLLAQDLRMAGVGVGYRPDGSFGGVGRGAFTVNGGANFNGNDRPITLAAGAVVTDDLLIRHASGRVRTVGMFAASTGEICVGSDLDAGDLAIMMTREGLHARTVRIDSVAPSSCTGGVCLNGCDRFTWSADTTYQSDAYAVNANYAGGELIGDFSEIVWFVEPDAGGIGQLRRAEVTVTEPCAARDETCGGLVASGVETVQVAVWQWDSIADDWAERTTAGDVTDRDRIRIDVELVVRGSNHHRSQHHAGLALQVGDGQCLPAPCGTASDGIERRVLRTSVEVRNAGRMILK